MIIICIVLAGIGLWIYGRRTSSRVAAFAGGLAIAAPLLYAGGAMLLPLAPMLALGAAYWTVDRNNDERQYDQR